MSDDAAAGAGAGKAPEGQKLPLVGSEDIMCKKAHGTSDRPVQEKLLYGVDRQTADRICSFNRHYAEHSGYFKKKKWVSTVRHKGAVTYYDSVTGRPLFVAPRGRSFDAFLEESEHHGWPSFRDQEVVWDNVRCLRNGECVSLAGTHLGHNLPDKRGNRYCINLCCVSGQPVAEEPEKQKEEEARAGADAAAAPAAEAEGEASATPAL